MYKVLAIAGLFAVINAAPVSHQATSYSSVNNYQSAVQHIASAPSSIKYAAQATPIYTAAAVTKAIFAAPVAKIGYATGSYSAHQQEEYLPAKYEYTYGIEDPHTGDVHSQEEHRDGDHVVGQYSLHEADGTVRIVRYSDDGHGFNAIVERQGYPTEAPAVYKKVVAVGAPNYHY